MRGAIEYGQPLAGTSRVGQSDERVQSAEAESDSAKRIMLPPRLPPGLGPTNLFQPRRTFKKPPFGS